MSSWLVRAGLVLLFLPLPTLLTAASLGLGAEVVTIPTTVSTTSISTTASGMTFQTTSFATQVAETDYHGRYYTIIYSPCPVVPGLPRCMAAAIRFSALLTADSEDPPSKLLRLTNPEPNLWSVNNGTFVTILGTLTTPSTFSNLFYGDLEISQIAIQSGPEPPACSPVPEGTLCLNMISIPLVTGNGYAIIDSSILFTTIILTAVGGLTLFVSNKKMRKRFKKALFFW